ncbi:hypothetical protein MMC28_010924 [Mycoblastus sanguinarius]|nr:hypothetical protein [Mycoblastus sanguinarius]
MEDRKNSLSEPKDWRVDLYIWRINRELCDDGKYRMVLDQLMFRTEVYPDTSVPLPKLIISKQDLVTLHRSQDQSLLDTKMEIDLAKVHIVARRAVKKSDMRSLQRGEATAIDKTRRRKPLIPRI